MTLTSGTLLRGRYEILEVLGEGAMSTVYQVQDSTSGETRALKAFEPRAATPAEQAEAGVLFEQEIEILALLQHPCIPRLHESFSEGGRRYFVMDYVDGRTLEAIVDQNGPAPESYVLPIAIQMASLLAWLHVHPRGPIVFRDMKPSNVMVDYDGRVHLIDFGVARFWKPGQVADTFPMGTPGFAAPEQYGAAQSGPSTDLYAMAATLYRTLSGQDPDPDSGPRPPLRTVAPDCSQEMEDLLAWCLEPDPSRRPQSAAEVLARLFELQRDRYPTVTIPSLPAVEPPASAIPRGARLWLAGCGWAAIIPAACILLALFFFFFPLDLFRRPHGVGYTTACKSNLKNLGTALEMYAEDNHGLFPTTLAALTPTYLKTIPTCPSAGADTYSGGYRGWNADPPAYTVVCVGHNHQGPGYSVNYPQYTSRQGLLER